MYSAFLSPVSFPRELLNMSSRENSEFVPSWSEVWVACNWYLE